MTGEKRNGKGKKARKQGGEGERERKEDARVGKSDKRHKEAARYKSGTGKETAAKIK